MLTQQRYEGEATMAAAARDAATDNDLRFMYDQIWAEQITAARHARLAARCQLEAGEAKRKATGLESAPTVRGGATAVMTRAQMRGYSEDVSFGVKYWSDIAERRMRAAEAHKAAADKCFASAQEMRTEATKKEAATKKPEADADAASANHARRTTPRHE
jgi:hypothetical protein